MNNMHSLIKEEIRIFAQDVRTRYPRRAVLNELVFKSAIREFARLGLIVLVDKNKGIPPEMATHQLYRLKRIRRQPVWMPTWKFPKDPAELGRHLTPALEQGKVTWRHSGLAMVGTELPSGRDDQADAQPSP